MALASGVFIERVCLHVCCQCWRLRSPGRQCHCCYRRMILQPDRRTMPAGRRSQSAHSHTRLASSTTGTKLRRAPTMTWTLALRFLTHMDRWEQIQPRICYRTWCLRLYHRNPKSKCSTAEAGYEMVLIEMFTQTLQFCWWSPYPQAIQDVDEFVSSSDLEKCSITSLLSSGCSAVNGCHQNESPNSC